MGILVNTGFKVGSAEPLDEYSVRGTIADRDALVTDGYAYEGMEVYCKDTKAKYRWSGTDWEEVGSGGGSGAGIASDVAYDNAALADVDNVKEALDTLISEMYYVEPSVTSFTATQTGGVFEIGTTITAPVTFNWSYNKDITTQTLTDCTLADETIRTATYNTDITTNKTFTLSASDGKNNVSKSISYTFVNPYYTGVSTTDTLTETDVTALTKKVVTKGTQTVNYTTSQSHMVFAYPSSYGAIKSVIDQNGFNVTDSFTKSTLTINSAEYYIYVSNKCSGTFIMKFNY